jgi:ACS family pantothenate transporter-like MFS transporter
MSNIILENTKQHIDESSLPEPDGNASHKDRTHASTSSSMKATEGRGWLHWHQPGASKREKRLICKLDWFLLSYGCLCLFNKNLDQNNISNAYVSGMKEELGFGKGNELSWMTTYFLVGYIFGAPISNLILTIAPPRIVLPSFMLAWSIFVLFLFKCNSAAEFYALRFCIGFFESSAIPGIHYVLGSWYRKSELATRSSFFIMSGVLGQMFSGYLQSALYACMEGRGGMSAWRWLFIFDFILAIPIVVYGFVGLLGMKQWQH